jgi:hypothetical protein
MRRRKRTAVLAVLACAGAVAIGAVATDAAPFGTGHSLTNVPTANTKSPGYAPASKLSPQLAEIAVAQGSTRLENGTAQVGYFGYDNDLLNAAGDAQMLPTPTVSDEAQKTEPDKNTYLVFKRSLARRRPALLVRDAFPLPGPRRRKPRVHHADQPRRRRGAPRDAARPGRRDRRADRGHRRLDLGPVGEASAVHDRERLRPDLLGHPGLPVRRRGRLRRPRPRRLRGDPGRRRREHLDRRGQPNSPDQLALHIYGSSFRTRWITIHDTAVDGNTPFNANTLAAHDGTPFKRPENGVFRPAKHFKEFFFDETGDTNATSPENATAGGWCSIFRLDQKSPSADTGTLSIFYKCDGTRAGFDNIQFLSKDTLGIVEDAGDTLHSQRNALDSAYAFDVNLDYSSPAKQPVRWLAEGRDASATIDSAFDGFGKNEGDNEITGLHVSDGDTSVGGVLGTKAPKLWHGDWRWFYTQQHGDNPTYEVVPAG